MTQVLQFFSAITGYSDYLQRESEARAGIIAKVGDVVRCSLITENIEQIPRVLKALVKVARRKNWMFSIKNSWNDQNGNVSLLGYTSIHVKMLITLPGNKRILVEVQIHPQAIKDGTGKCAQQIAHRLYKLPEDDAEEAVPLDVQSCSQLVYLTAITTLSYTEAQHREVNARLDALRAYQRMTEEKKKERVILATAMLLTNDPEKFGTDHKWSKTYNAFLPKNREAVADALRVEKRKINAKLHQLGLAECFEGASDPALMTNTATSLKEFLQNAEKVAPIFNQICNGIARSQPGCFVSLGPRQMHMIKDPESLERKVNKIRQRQLRQEGRAPRRCVTWVRNPTCIKTAVLSALVMCAGGAGMIANNKRHEYSTAIQLKDACLINLTTAQTGHALIDGFFTKVTDQVGFLRQTYPEPEIQNLFPLSQLSLAQINASTDVVIAWPTNAVQCLIDLKACGKLKDTSTELHKRCLENLAATQDETIKAQDETIQERGKCKVEVIGAKDQTIGAMDQTIATQSDCSAVVAPLQIRVGECTKLEEIQEENNRLTGVEKRCIADTKDREKDRDHYKYLYDESQKIFIRRWLGL